MTAAEKSGASRTRNSLRERSSRRPSCTTVSCNHCELRKEKQMPRKGKSAVRRAGGAVARTARKLTEKLNPRNRSAKKAEAAKSRVTKPQGATARRKQPRTDVPLDLIASTYSPKQTSLKTSFRSDGA